MNTEFQNAIKEFFHLHTELGSLAAVVKERRGPIRDKLSVTEKTIEEFMDKMGLRIVNYNSNKLELVEFERRNALTKERMENALLSYFQNDAAQASDCLNHIYASAGTTKGVRLKKTIKRTKAKDAPKQVQPLYEPLSSDDDEND